MMILRARFAIVLGALLLTGASTLSATEQDGSSKAVTRLSQPVESTDTHEIFGAPLPESGDLLSLAELIEGGDEYAGKDILLSTRVAKVCQKKGCFFIAAEGANSARISFKDYAFFIPTDAGGKQVILAGEFSRKPVTPEQAAHFADDLGGDAPSDPSAYEYSIVATSVSIPLAH